MYIEHKMFGIDFHVCVCVCVVLCIIIFYKCVSRFIDTIIADCAQMFPIKCINIMLLKNISYHIHSV